MNLALWAAKTGLDAQNTQMAVIANNLANSNTTGYKAARAAFQDLMYQNVQQVGAQSTQNTQYSTGLSLGTGFFQITMPDGTLAYTRDGSFSMDSSGNVVNASGYPISPAITIPITAQS